MNIVLIIINVLVVLCAGDTQLLLAAGREWFIDIASMQQQQQLNLFIVYVSENISHPAVASGGWTGRCMILPFLTQPPHGNVQRARSRVPM